MKKLLIATHAHMASGIVSTIDLLTGCGSRLKWLDAYVDETDVVKELRDFISDVTEGDQGIIFTDLRGGSVNQQVMNLLQEASQNIIVVTGINLPVILEIALSDETIDKQKVQEIVEMARGELCCMDLKQTEEPMDEDSFFE
ncbi:MAG: PTS fructose transporter subunit IIA [Erysipelotrichaceae bacterium]|nr:PTS fructose transporter subunit IIA [Erysipelotrichaceae bacterium]MBQ7888351.1 PTS fructose transporter subunit IIA [Erysipelotrichaceae bacterium]